MQARIGSWRGTAHRTPCSTRRTSTAREGRLPYPQRAIRTKDFLYIRAEENLRELYEIGFGKRPEEELFDLRKDPHHMNNLAGDPAYEKILKELADRLTQVLKAQDDPRVVESPCRFEHQPYTS